MVLFLRKGKFVSFLHNLAASAKGVRSPIMPGLLGPLRVWIYPKNFRSKRVKNATATRTDTIVRNQDILTLYCAFFKKANIVKITFDGNRYETVVSSANLPTLPEKNPGS